MINAVLNEDKNQVLLTMNLAIMSIQDLNCGYENYLRQICLNSVYKTINFICY